MAETIAPFKYAAPLSHAIQHLKYHRRLSCGRDLGYLLANELGKRKLPEIPDVLIPVPLNWKRQFWRGFNQSAEIARPISKSLGIPIDLRLLRRKVHTAPQVGLMPAQRRRNIQKAFECRCTDIPVKAAIVDDVITSGSTATEVARCLTDAGVQRIFVWALARV